MIPFTTTPEQKIELYEIATQMRAEGLPASFIAGVIKRAEQCEGTFELALLWRDAADVPEEREQIIADCQELLDEGEEAPPAMVEKPYVRFDDLQSIADKVTAFKHELRKKVDQCGGINQLARTTGIPQPSLSRFFNTASMPRRTTLYKIAKALNLSETDIATDFVV